MKQPKYSDAQIWAAWITTRNVLAVAAEVGCSESAAYARLKKLGATFAPIGRPKGYKPTKAETPSQVNSAALAAKRIAGEFANVPLGQWLVDINSPVPSTALPCNDPVVATAVASSLLAAGLAKYEERDGERILQWTDQVLALRGRIAEPVLPAACKDPAACRREIEARQAWWLPIVECREVELLEGAPPHYEYRIKLCTNQPLTKGDVESIFVLGVPAMHKKRGERAPCDCIAAQEADDDDAA